MTLVDQNKWGDPMFVYFGSTESLVHEMKHLQQVAIQERFTFPSAHKQVRFLVNSEAQCRLDNGFSKSDEFVMALYLHAEQPAAKLMEFRDDVFSQQSVFRWLTSSIVNYEMRYDQRAYFAMEKLKLSTLIYMRDSSEEEADQLVEIMTKLSKKLRQTDFNILILVADP